MFEAHRRRQYARELLFFAMVELTMLVSLGLRPSLHAAARQMPAPPVSLASLYDKANHAEPGMLRAPPAASQPDRLAMLHGSADRSRPVIGPVMAAVGTGAGSLVAAYPGR